MHRCYISPASWSEREIRLEREETHHLVKVLRARPGERVVVFDGGGREMDAEVLDPGRGWLKGVGEARHSPRPGHRLVLIQALPKGRVMDGLIDKAVELGVSEIWPVITERVVSRPGCDRVAGKVSRWRRIALSATRQSGRAWTSEVASVTRVEDVWPRLAALDGVLMGALDARAVPLDQAVQELKDAGVHRVGFMIGPEGDWTREEVTRAMEAGARVVDFGTSVLRVDTAALYALSVWAYHFPGGGKGRNGG